MTRVVVVGEVAEAGLTNSLITGFRHVGCAVTVLALGPWRPPQLASAALRYPSLAAKFRKAFIRRVDETAEHGSAALVLVVKGTLIGRQTLDHLRSHFNSPVLCWNPDSPFDSAISNRGGGIRKTIGSYDGYITWAEDVADKLSKMARHVIVVPFAWDPSIMQPAAGHGVAAGRVIFIGTATRERVELMRTLAHLKPVVFGTEWPTIDGVELRSPVRGLNFARVTGEASWSLNFLRPQNAHSHNMRTFEIVGSGGNQIAPETTDHKRFLGKDSHTLLFRNTKELEIMLRTDPHTLSSRSPDILKGHTYADRIAHLLTELGITEKNGHQALGTL